MDETWRKRYDRYLSTFRNIFLELDKIEKELRIIEKDKPLSFGERKILEIVIKIKKETK